MQNILFLDIETVPDHEYFTDLDPALQTLRTKKTQRFPDDLKQELDDASLYENRAGIFAEFGKIICISLGYITKNHDWVREMRMKSFAGDDEKRILMDCFDMMESYFSATNYRICGHNITEFDVPYISRRAVVHDLSLPSILHTQGKKPREINHLDTLEMRKFWDRKAFVSLDLLTRVLGLPTPKTDISWEQVAGVYYKEKDLNRIVAYCERDIIAVATILKKYFRNTDTILGMNMID